MSTRPAIGVRGSGYFAARRGERLPENVDPIFLPLLGKPWRKIGRFIKLGMAGAVLAARRGGLEKPPAERTGIFLGTGLGNLSELLPFSDSVFSEGDLFPSPIQFANSVGNAGAFYIAQAFGLTGPVVAISQEEASFECALINARALLATGDIDYALVGGLDIFEPTPEDHLGRMGYEPGSGVAMGEGSAWLLLERLSEKSVAVLESASVGYLEDPAAELARALDAPGPARVALNTRLAPRASELLPPGSNLYDPGFGAFLTETAAVASAFLEDESCAGATLHAISGTRDGCIGRLRLRRLATREGAT